MSKVKSLYWECKKKPNGKFEVNNENSFSEHKQMCKVTEKGVMHAVFRKSDCHLLIKRLLGRK